MGSRAESMAPMERLTVILAVLAKAEGREVAVDDILVRVSYGAGRVQDRRDQLRRDVRNLETLGWDIRQVGPPGEEARYRLVAGDNRLRVELSPEQRFALWRAALLTGLPDIAEDLAPGELPSQEPAPGDGFVGLPDETATLLEAARHAVAARCVVRFDYKGRPRVAHPQAVHLRPAGWYLTAREDGDELVKSFVLDRMSELTLDAPGTADPPPPEPDRPKLDPVSWDVDPLIDAEVETTDDHRPRVEALLGEAAAARPGAAPGRVLLTIPVTSRRAFLGRLYQLGTRVTLVGPPELRDVLRDSLLAVIRSGGSTAPAGGAR